MWKRFLRKRTHSYKAPLQNTVWIRSCSIQLEMIIVNEAIFPRNLSSLTAAKMQKFGDPGLLVTYWNYTMKLVKSDIVELKER